MESCFTTSVWAFSCSAFYCAPSQSYILGRFFTPNVAIVTNHRLVGSGPYRFIRHLTYSGFLTIMFGFGLACANAASLCIMFLPVTSAVLWRIHVEERALTAAFGEQYRAYAARTKRLIPFVF